MENTVCLVVLARFKSDLYLIYEMIDHFTWSQFEAEVSHMQSKSTWMESFKLPQH